MTERILEVKENVLNIIKKVQKIVIVLNVSKWTTREIVGYIVSIPYKEHLGTSSTDYLPIVLSLH